MKVENIKLNKNGKYEVTINNEKYKLYQDVVIKYLLFSKKDVDEKLLEQIKGDNLFYENYYKIIKFINVKLRTENEIRKKLNTLNVLKKEQDSIIELIKKQGYLNDEIYIKSYINDKINLSYEGPFKIKNYLLKNGFDEIIISKYLDFDNEFWKERIGKIINKKIKTNKNYSKKMLIQKLSSELNNLGYSKDMYNTLLNNISFDDDSIYEKEYNKIYNKLIKKYPEDKAKLLTKQKLYLKGFYK